MTLMIAQLGSSQPVTLAAQELHDYLHTMDPASNISILCPDAYDPDRANTLWVGLDPAFDAMLPEVENKNLDDAILLKVSGCTGIVTGANPRSVLIAAYRLLRENGCAFIRPDRDGERVPKLPLEQICADVCEVPSCRHRGVCIEGAVSYDHVVNMIRYLPKLGMNSYFIQFIVPTVFFERWYTHAYNPKYPSQPMSRAEIRDMKRAVVREIKARGLLFHDVGHGWTAEPFGIEGDTWNPSAGLKLPETYANSLALVNGKRELWHGGVPLDTNLCYGSTYVRETMVNGIADYCAKNPEVDYIHFWLADSVNNHCECPLCRDTTPSDFFIMMLNELDEELTRRGITTKVVFLIYVETLWAPEKLRLNNPERFVLMFAPITRSYNKSFAPDMKFDGEIPPYRRNQVKLPRSVEENVEMLRKWQDIIQCDGFDFDYHYMWAHMRDLSYYGIARILMDDMKNMHSIGLNGMVSCQNQRVFMPTALGMHAMATGLWDQNSDFDEMAKRYFADSFGENGESARRYLEKMSILFNYSYISGETARVNPEHAQRCRDLHALVTDFIPTIEANILTAADACIKLSWEMLRWHAYLMLQMSDMLELRAEGRDEEAWAAWEKTREFTRDTEKDVHPWFDTWEFNDVYSSVMKIPAKQ